VTDDGDVYRLSKCTGQGRAAGQGPGQAVEGGGFGIHMSGPSLAVKSLEVVKA
jgi:hypothetical protein